MPEKKNEIRVDNSVCYLDEDEILHIISRGEVDEEHFNKMSVVTTKATEAIEGKVKILVDLNHCGKVSASVRRLAKRDFEKEKTGKVAMFGMHPVARILASFIIGITRKDDIRFFKTKEEALVWLKAGGS